MSWRAAPWEWRGDYACLVGVEPGRSVSVRYPWRQAWTRQDVGTASLDLQWRGDTVVATRPEGMVMALYQRDDLDREEAPLAGAPTRTAPDGFHLW